MSQKIQLENNNLLDDAEEDEDNRRFQEKLKFEDFIDFMCEDLNSSKDILTVVKKVRESVKLRESVSKSM
jgi:hypothetical protein